MSVLKYDDKCFFIKFEFTSNTNYDHFLCISFWGI